jgi:uncharacterized protein (TIGR02246 family)
MSLGTLTAFGRRYAQAWCDRDPQRVASFYAETGSLIVNGSAPAVGREAIAEVARSFMTEFPDMHVSMKALTREARGTVFHWSLTGTNTGPGGKGHRVRIDGYEVWTLDGDDRIAESKDHFDAAEYAFQIENGFDAPRHETDDPPSPVATRSYGRSTLVSNRRGRKPGGSKDGS